MIYKLKNINPAIQMLVLFLIFLAIAITQKGNEFNDGSKVLLTVTSFVFGFYINNLVTQARNRHSKVVDSLREEGGYMKAIYYIVEGAFSKNDLETQRQFMDNYLMASMDYKITDYAKSSTEFRNLFNHVMLIEFKDKKQDNAYNHLVRIMGEVSKNRVRVETLVKERVSSFEWLTVLALLLVVLFFVFNLNDGTIISVLITSLIATSLSMLVVILHSLDSLRWKENKWFWEPIEELFNSLDLVPYYPKPLIDEHRVKLTKNQKVRIAGYSHPYPDMTDKSIKVLH